MTTTADQVSARDRDDLEAEPTRPEGAGRARWATWTAIVATLVALHLVLSRSLDGFILADGTGYLANARWLVGKAGSTWQGPAAFYNAGWSLLVAPIYLFTRAPSAVHSAVVVLNALLASLSFVAYAALAERVFALPRRLAILAGLAAALYPAVLLQAGFEWSESLFHLLFPILLLAVDQLLRERTPRWAVCTGIVAAALNATHPKGLGAVVAIAIALAILGWREVVPRRAAAAGLVALVVAFAATRVLHGALQDALYAKSASAIEGDVLKRLTDPALVWGSFKRLWGQLWYLTVASVGLFPLGVYTLVRHRDRRFSTIALGTCLAILAASCLEMSDGTRVDHMVYGRYDEGFLPALIVAGAAGLFLYRDRIVRFALAGASMSVAFGAAALLLNGSDRFHGSVMPLNVVGVLLYQRDVDAIDVVFVTLVALVPLIAVAAATRVATRLGLLVVVAFFAISSFSVEARTIRPWEDFWSSVTDIPLVVDRIGHHGPIGYDLASYDVDAADAYQLELTDVGPLLFFDSRTSEHLPGSDLVIAGPEWDRPGARVAYVEKGPHAQALWVLPGALQRRLDDEGFLLPEQHSAALTPDEQRARLEVDRDGDRLVVHLEDRGGAWLPADLIPGVITGSVRVGARWYDGDAEVASTTGELPRMLLPGDRADVDVAVPDLPPGTYRVVVSLRQEGVAWWDASAVTTRVTVE